jgi:hypothetical protein
MHADDAWLEQLERQLDHQNTILERTLRELERCDPSARLSVPVDTDGRPTTAPPCSIPTSAIRA